MKENSGLTTEDAQRMICHGTLGGKEWSSEQRQAACLRVDEPYVPVGSSGFSYSDIALLAAGVLLLIGVLIFFFKLRQKRSLTARNEAQGRKKVRTKSK